MSALSRGMLYLFAFLYYTIDKLNCDRHAFCLASTLFISSILENFCVALYLWNEVVCLSNVANSMTDRWTDRQMDGWACSCTPLPWVDQE